MLYTDEVVLNAEQELEKMEKTDLLGVQSKLFKWTTRNENNCSIAVNVLLDKEQKVIWPLIQAPQFDLWGWIGGKHTSSD